MADIASRLAHSFSSCATFTRLRSELFGGDADLTAQFLDAVLSYCTPLWFAQPQRLFYKVLCDHLAFTKPVAAATVATKNDKDAAVVRVRFFGPDYNDRPTEECYFDVAQFIESLSEALFDQRLCGTLTELVQLPYPVARALLFVQKRSGDEFFLRRWMAGRFFATDSCEEINSWLNPSLRLLQTPEYFDLVWLNIAEECCSGGAATALLQPTALALVEENCVNTSTVALMERCCYEQTAPRVLLTCYIHFMHRMAESSSSTSLNLCYNLDDARPLFEVYLAMLLGITHHCVVDALARLSAPMLHSISRWAEEMRAFLSGSAAASPSPLLRSLYARTMSFDTVFMASTSASNAVLVDRMANNNSTATALDTVYAPLRECDAGAFVKQCVEDTQVLQLYGVERSFPGASQMDSAKSGLGIWRLPENVRVHRVACSLKFFWDIAEGIVRLDNAPPFVSADTHGPFVVTTQRNMRILQAAMLMHTLCTPRSCKPFAAYPALAQLYMFDYDGGMGAWSLFARHAFVQVLAHWLLVKRGDGVYGIAEGVPTPAHRYTPAFVLLNRVHSAICVLWNGDAEEAAPQVAGPYARLDALRNYMLRSDNVAVDRNAAGFYERLEALRSFLLLYEVHWLPLTLLVKLDDARINCLSASSPLNNSNTQLVHALRCVLEERVNTDSDASAPITDRPSAEGRKRGVSAATEAGRKRGNSGGNDDTIGWPLAFQTDELQHVYELLPPDHPFLTCANEDQIAMINVTVYECALAIHPLLATSDRESLRSLSARVMLAMRTSLSMDAPLTMNSYRRSMYRSAPEEALECCYDTQQQPPQTPTTSYHRTRVDVSQNDTTRLIRFLGQLERVVLVDKRAGALVTQEGAASPPVATYYSDFGRDCAITFAAGLCLVDLLPHAASSSDPVKKHRARQARRSFGKRSVTVADRCVNIVSAEFDVYAEYSPAYLSPPAVNATLNAVLAYKNSSSDSRHSTE